ncbi:MAG: methyltransferase domain-containing protein [Acidimicrobiales bacterium]
MRRRPIAPLAPGEWLDGREAAVAAAVVAATDRSSTSDELADAADDQITRYHLAASRADVLRALDLPAGATVLEVGAGCGAVTRYLGEVAGRVDAWEPTLARVAVARARVADLATVEVHVGGLDDIPAAAVADVVVAVGVVEHLAAERPLAAVVAALAGHVADGGHLVVAVENRLGVKYLCGAPEDHEGVPWIGIEGYRHAHPRARTPSRADLAGALSAVGLDTVVLGALPDYKHARLVLAPALLDHPGARGIATTAGLFPSDDVGGTRAPAADERAVWRQFVAAGLGPDVVNSFVAVGRRGGPVALWPADRLAVAHTSDRRAPFATRTILAADATGTVAIARRRLAGDDPVVDAAGLRLDATVAGWVEGTDLLDVVADEPDRRPALLAAWASLVDDAVDADGRRALDAVPRNVVVAPDGTCALIDQEWWAAGVSAAEVVGRGLLGAAIALGEVLPPAPTAPGTVGDLALRLGDELMAERGRPLGDCWLDEAVAAEAHLRARIELRDDAGEAIARDHHTALLHAALHRPVGGAAADRARIPAALTALARVAELEAAVADQQNDLRRHVEHAAETDTAFRRTHEDLLQAQAAIVGLHEEVARRDADLLGLETTLAGQQVDLRRYVEHAAEADAAFTRTHAELVDAQHAIVALHEEVARRDANLLALAGAAGRAAREHADAAAALGEEMAHTRRAAAAATELVSQEAALARRLAVDLAAERAEADGDAAAEVALYDHLAALHRTKVLRWTAPARRWWGSVLRAFGADADGPTTVPPRRTVTRRRRPDPAPDDAGDDPGPVLPASGD